MFKIYIIISLLIVSVTSSLSQRVSFNVPDHPINIPFSDFTAHLEENREVRFFFKGKWVNQLIVRESYVGVEINQALKEILEGENIDIEYLYDYGVVLIKDLSIEKLNALISDSLRKNYINKIIGKEGSLPWGTLVTLSGKIREDKFQEPVVGATIISEDAGISTTSDIRGDFKIRLPVGSHLLSFQTLNYEKQAFLLTIYESGNLDIILKEDPLVLNEIIVQSDIDEENFETEVTAKTIITAKEIQEIPTFLGEVDVVKSIQLLPGVNNVGEGSSGFNVRGGSADQNLILLDEAIVFNPNHLFGFFSAFHPDAVEEVAFYRGAMPAEYGGRVSSVLDVKQKDGDLSKLHGSGGIGVVTSRLMLEGPIINDKLSFLVAGRTSYSDWVLKQVNDLDVRNSNAFFYDITGKITFKNNEKSKLTGTLYASKDRFQFASDTTFAWENRSFSLNHEKIISPVLSIKSSISAGSYNYEIEDEGLNESFSWKYKIQNVKLKSYISIRKNKHEFQLGVDFTGYEFNRGSIVPLDEQSSIGPTELPKEQSLVSGLFITDNFQLSNKLFVSLGLRASHYQLFGEHNEYVYNQGFAKSDFSITDTVFTRKGNVAQQYSGLEPRLSAKYSFNTTTILKGAFVRSYQYVHLLSNTTAISPIDSWTPSTAHIKPQIGAHYSLGLYKTLKSNQIRTSIEIFYKKIDNVPEYIDGAQLALKENVETEITNSEADIRGLEFSVQKDGRLSTNLSYTFTSSRRRTSSEFIEAQINDNELFPSNYDQPHNIKLNTEYGISKRHILLFNFNLASGRPITVPEERFRIDNNFVGNFSERNSFRLPVYHRLDVTLLIKSNHKKNKKWEGTWAFTIYNVYSRENVYSVFFEPDRFGRPTAFQIAILGAAFPSVTYNFKF